MPEFLNDSKAQYDQALKDAGSKLVVIDFTAMWCGPCQMIKPKFEKMAEDFPDVMFFKVDVDVNEETSEAENISAMPTFVFYKNGEKIHTITGADEAALRKKINELK